MEVVSDFYLEDIRPKVSTIKKLGFRKAPRGNFIKLIEIDADTVQNCLNETQQVFREVFELELSNYNLETDLTIPDNSNRGKKETGFGLTKIQKKWLWGAAFIIVLFLLGRKSSNDTNTDHTYYTKRECYTATSKEKLEEVYQYAVDNDYQAVSQLINQGDAMILPQGTEVYLVDASLTYNIVRLKGSTQKLWIASGILNVK